MQEPACGPPTLAKKEKQRVGQLRNTQVRSHGQESEYLFRGNEPRKADAAKRSLCSTFWRVYMKLLDTRKPLPPAGFRVFSY